MSGRNFKLHSLEDLDKLPPPEWLIEPIFQVDSQVILFGPPGEGKSFVALSFALSIASGLSWAGRRVKHGPVIYVAAEGGRGIRKRVAAWQHEMGVDGLGNTFFLLDAPQLGKGPDVANLITAIANLPAKPLLIVIDTLSRTLVGADENAAKDVGMWIEGSRKLQQATGATVLALHHTVKRQSRQKAPAERGSGALRGAADTMLAVRKGREGVLSLSCEKQKDEEEFEPILLEMKRVSVGEDALGQEITSLVLVPVDAPNPPEQTASLAIGPALALEVLRELGGDATKKDWMAAIEGRNGVPLAERTFYNWRDALLERGLVQSVGRGGYQLPRDEVATANELPNHAIQRAA